MDVTLLLLPASFLFLLLLPRLLLKIRNAQLRQVHAGTHPPPRPWNLPIIGSLHLIGPRPHQSLDALAKRFGSVVLLKLGEVPTLVVSSAEAAAEITKTQDLCFASRPIIQSDRIFSSKQK